MTDKEREVRRRAAEQEHGEVVSAANEKYAVALEERTRVHDAARKKLDAALAELMPLEERREYKAARRRDAFIALIYKAIYTFHGTGDVKKLNAAFGKACAEYERKHKTDDGGR
jgi:ArsR family metal-binding transcriptional regulator